jgi:DNA-binding MarR family transcriptional regulator
VSEDETLAQVPRRVARLPTWLLSQAHMRAHRLLSEAFAQHGARGYHYRLLAALEEFGPESQRSLGRRTGIDPSDVVAALNDLESEGMVLRSRDGRDRRRNTINITASGTARLTELDAVVSRVQEALLAALTPRERSELLRMLGGLAHPPA